MKVHNIAHDDKQSVTSTDASAGWLRYREGVEQVWLFANPDRRALEIRRKPADEGAVLVVRTLDEEPRQYQFADLDALGRFQRDMEQFLMRTGWALERFSPDRRTGSDRRSFPRAANDRRRWWTDGRVPKPRRRRR
jgi:hypothetical protein